MSKIELIPVGGRVLVKPAKVPDVNPDLVRRDCPGGVVVAVGGGTGGEYSVLDYISVGDTLYCGYYTGTDVTLEGRKYLVLDSTDILLIVPKTED